MVDSLFIKKFSLLSHQDNKLSGHQGNQLSSYWTFKSVLTVSKVIKKKENTLETFKSFFGYF